MAEPVKTSQRASNSVIDAPKRKCLICHRFYDVVKVVNGYMLYSHSDLKHNHEYGEKIK